jgi:magnesium transporter
MMNDDRENDLQEKVWEYIPQSEDILDTQTGHIDDLLNEKLENAFHKQTSQVIVHDIAKIASEHDPIDLAHAVARLPAAVRPIIYENLPDTEAKIIFLTHTGSRTRSAIFRYLRDAEIKQLMTQVPPDDAVFMLDDMPDRRSKRILDSMDPKKAVRIRQLQRHDRHSAGRLMTDEFFSFHLNTTIREVAAYVRDHPGIDMTNRIFVLTDSGELAGYVSVRNLLVNQPYLPIRQVMQPVLHKTTPNTDRDEVVELMERYTIPALPVVNEDDHLLGVVTYEDAIEAMKDIADETIASIAGTTEEVGEHEPLFQRFLGRAPWLLVTIFAGLLTATGMSYFHDRPWFLFVPLFITLITGMSGNVGIQCSTILVRGISTGELSMGNRREAITKELLMGLLIGSVFGILCGIVVYLMGSLGFYAIGTDPFIIGIMVSLGILGACMIATTLGTFSPFFFARFKIDPATASGPIVTAFNDVLATLIYFFIANIVSSFLLA